MRSRASVTRLAVEQVARGVRRRRPRHADQGCLRFRSQPAVDERISMAKDEHNRRVAAIQQNVLQKQKLPIRHSAKILQTNDSNSSSNTESKTTVAPSSSENTTTIAAPDSPLIKARVKHPNSHNVLTNNIQHWFSKDSTFFDVTMQELNLTAFASSDEMQVNQHPLEVVLHQYRQLYFESLTDFRQYLEGRPPALQSVMEELQQAGFGDPRWSKRFRQVRGYQLRKDQLERQYANQSQDLDRRELLLQDAQSERDLLLQTIDQSRHKELQRRFQVEQAQRQREEAFQARSQETTSLFSKVWDTLSSVFNTENPVNEEPKNEPNQAGLTLDQIPPPSRLQKRLRRKEMAIQDLRNEVKQATDKLTKIQKRREDFHVPLPPAEYQLAQQAIHKARSILCQTLAHQMQERHAQLIEQYQMLDAKTDLTKPHEWYSYARLDRRKIIFHGGPTNSGKTYSALQSLKASKKGLYLGPLRLLAAEIYEGMTAEGIYTNLFTGQERREIAFSTHASATVEMVDLNQEYDVVVVDEIQMISDVTRGAAWTKALLGLRCKEIHVCGGLEAKEVVRKLAKACGDDFELKEYDRFSPLQIASSSLAHNPKKAGSYRHVERGDCVVAFSRNDIFAIKREIEATTPYKCCVIYGKLPPQTRADQARRFNDPNSGYDVLVASDAIGMGLNLNIKRIIFNTVFKFNGEYVARLSHSEIKQISGRAGRRNSPYPHGEVTCRDPRDLQYIRNCLETEIEPIEKAALLPTAEHIELFSDGLKTYGVDDEESTLHQILRQFSAMATVKGDFFLGRQTEMRMIAKKLRDIPISLRDSYTMCLSPTNENSLALLQGFAWKLARGEVFGLPSRAVPKKAKSFDDLSYLCTIYADSDLFLWLQYKFPPSNAVEQQAALARKEKTLDFINDALGNTENLKLNHCYVRMANRNRAAWESENGPMYLEEGDTIDPEEEEDDDLELEEQRQSY